MTTEYIFGNLLDKPDGIKEEIRSSEEYIPGLVFNYPPIPVWEIHPEAAPPAGALWEGSDRFPLSLYIHIPFCRQKCSFCYYSVAVVKDEEAQIWEYLRCLEKEAIGYLPALRDARFRTVFIGGGTPSRLNEAQLEFLFTNVIGRFDLSLCREITFECAPESVTAGKLSVLRERGVSRVSMGVQSFDESILDRTRRVSDTVTLLDQYKLVVSSGIPNINIDLIAGVEREALQNMEHTMRTIRNLDQKPTQVTLFTLSVRKGSITFKSLNEASPEEIYANSLALYEYAKERLLEEGYWQYSKNLFPTKDWIFHYQDALWGNNGYVLALGASGYGHTERYTYQNHFDYRSYMRSIQAGKIAIEKTYPLSPKEQLHRHLVLAAKHKKINVAQFNSYYADGENVLARFDPIFEALIDLGVMVYSDGQYEYTDHGINSVDRYVRLFYSPEINRQLRALNERPARWKGDSFAYTV